MSQSPNPNLGLNDGPGSPANGRSDAKDYSNTHNAHNVQHRPDKHHSWGYDDGPKGPIPSLNNTPWSDIPQIRLFRPTPGFNVRNNLVGLLSGLDFNLRTLYSHSRHVMIGENIDRLLVIFALMDALLKGHGEQIITDEIVARNETSQSEYMQTVDGWSAGIRIASLSKRTAEMNDLARQVDKKTAADTNPVAEGDAVSTMSSNVQLPVDKITELHTLRSDKDNTSDRLANVVGTSNVQSTVPFRSSSVPPKSIDPSENLIARRVRSEPKPVFREIEALSRLPATTAVQVTKDKTKTPTILAMAMAQVLGDPLLSTTTGCEVDQSMRGDEVYRKGSAITIRLPR